MIPLDLKVLRKGTETALQGIYDKIKAFSIRFKGTPEGDGNLMELGMTRPLICLDLKVLRKGTETIPHNSIFFS